LPNFFGENIFKNIYFRTSSPKFLPHHVVAAAVLLDGGAALRALLRVGGDPVGRLGVVVALLDPLLDQVAPAVDSMNQFRP
jgi:hypothetical protein